MTDIEKMREWLKTFPGIIPDNFQIDYTDEIPGNAGLFPTGMQEINRSTSIGGDVTVRNQYNFGLYAVFEKPMDADEISSLNANWVMSLQKWVQEQSARGLAPVFGNINISSEVIKAQNGMFYGSKENGITGMYMITITVTFSNYYKGGN